VKKFRLNRRIPIVILLLLMALALALGALPSAPADEAVAATEVTVIPTLLIGLYASNHSPADGATGVALNANVSVSFNRSLNESSIENSSNFYMRRLLMLGTLSGTITYSPTSKTATFNPSSNLLPGTTYYVTLTDDIVDASGLFHLLNHGTWSFTTDTAPQIASRTPGPGATGVPLDTEVRVTFNKPMLSAAGAATLRKVGGGAVGLALALSADEKTLVIQPMVDLEPNTTYEVTLNDTLKSKTLVPLDPAPITWQFTTAAAAADAPKVTAKTPADGATGVPVNQVVAAVFDKDMDPSTITSATFYLAKSGGTPLPASVIYNSSSKTAMLDPIADLEEGATYLVTLSEAIKGGTGKALEGAPIVWSFSTAAAAPVLVSTSPADGATDVAVNQVITATFDKAMDTSTLTSATFYVARAGGSLLPAAVTYDAATKTATLDPVANLEAGATYTVTLSNGVKSATGQTLSGAPRTWSFTTADSGGTSSFSDVIPGVTPYSTAIAALAAENIITGFTDGTFRPNDFVTRQQFAKMIVLTLDLPVTGAEVCPFTDVANQTGTDPFYPSKYVAVCANAEITRGKNPTTFAPYDNITRQQLITMVARAANLPEPPATYDPPFTAAQFSLNDHYVNARKAAHANLLNGLLGLGSAYDFLASSTRGECAQLLYNLMNHVN